jgi:WD40 repeat protein
VPPPEFAYFPQVGSTCTLFPFARSVAIAPNGARIGIAFGRATFLLNVATWQAITAQQDQNVSEFLESSAVRLHDHENKEKATALAFSPDGTRIASIDEHAIKLWDAASGRTIATLNGHTGFVNCLAYSQDGERIASASDDRTVKMWDVGTRREIATLTGHTGAVKYVAFSPDNARIASASADQTLKLWDAATRREIYTLKGHAGSVNCVAFSPNGAWIVSASDDKTIRFWDAASGKQTATLKGHATSVICIALSPDGTRIASCGERESVKLWDVRMGQELLTMNEFKIDSGGGVAFTPDGGRLVLWDNARVSLSGLFHAR